MAKTANSKSGRKRALIAGGTLLGIAVLATSAAFTDFANLNFGSGTDGTGIGGEGFNIQVVDTDAAGIPILGSWQEANTAEGVNINVVGADTIYPGSAPISVEIPYRNASTTIDANIDLSLKQHPTRISDAIMFDALRYTVEVDGTAVLTNVTAGAVADIDLGRAINPAVEKTLKVTISLPDQGTETLNNALNGKVAHVQANFIGESA